MVEKYNIEFEIKSIFSIKIMTIIGSNVVRGCGTTMYK